MEKNNHLITRFNYIKAYGVEYDVEIIKEQCEAYANQKRRERNITFFVPHNLDWRMIEGLH